MNKQAAKILVAEDDQHISRMLKDYLSAAGYDVSVVHRGHDAIDFVQKTPPDLILLDVMMPGIDGFEVCRRLKAAPETAIIPIIMTTALADRDKRLQGISAGADDYLTKPIDPKDLMLRVGNAVRMKSLYNDLERSFSQLRDVENLRDNLMHLIVHDLRSPIQSILGYLDLVKKTATDKQARYIGEAQESGRILERLISDLLTVHQLESGKIDIKCQDTRIGSIWSEAKPALSGIASMRKVEMVSFIPPDAFPIYADPNLVRRVVINLVDNALKFTPSGGRVEISAREVHKSAGQQPEASTQNSWAVVSVQDTGPGIPPEYYTKIFEKFGTVQARQAGARSSTGLGLAFCKLAIEAHGGRIGVQSQVGVGSMFWFALPTKSS